MELFNSLIKDTQALLEHGAPKCWDYSERDCWTDIGSSELVLQKDAAYELGAAGKGSANYVLFTSSPELVSKDQVLLYGPDLKDIKGDCEYYVTTLDSTRIQPSLPELVEAYLAVKPTDEETRHKTAELLK